MKNIGIFFVISLISVGFLASCSEGTENKGYVTKFSDFSNIKAGTSKSDVLAALGSPTTTSMYGQETWFYIGKEQTKETFFRPEVKSYDGYEITFKGDIVDSVTKKDSNSLREVEVSSDSTKTSGNEITVWQQLFGNLGKFNPASRMDKGVQTGVTPGSRGPKGY